MSNQDINELPTLKINVPSFLLKTYEILENPSLSHVIAWNQDGNAFIVFNSSELSQKVLANYFKHKNYPSFLRQLNMYNFKKTKNQYGQSEFKHKWFRRGLKSMLQYIRRRNQEESEQKIETRDSNQELDGYKKEHEEMKQTIKDVRTKQEQMMNDFKASMEQNASVSQSNNSVLMVFLRFQQVHESNATVIQQKIRRSINDLSKSDFSYPINKQEKSSKNQEFQIGDIISNVQPFEESHQNNIMPYQDSYSNVGSPYPNFNTYNSPIHYLFQRQNNQFQDYYFQFDPSILSYNRQPQSQLALPAPQINSYLPSQNYSLRSSVSNSPYRLASPSHTSTTDSKYLDKVYECNYNQFSLQNL